MSIFFHEISYAEIPSPQEYFLEEGLVLPVSLQSAAPKRQLDFLAGRFCGAKALADAGGPSFPSQIAIRETRAPRWPEGYVGSITHTKNYAAAVVARQSSFQGLGIDAELILDEASDGLIKQICTESEKEALSLFCSNKNELLSLIFSAKESLFKCLHPIDEVFFGFKDAEIVSFGDNEVNLTLKKDLPSFSQGFSIRCQYHIENSIVLSKVCLPPFKS